MSVRLSGICELPFLLSGEIGPARAAHHVGSHGGVSAPVWSLQGKPRVAAKEGTAAKACRGIGTRLEFGYEPISPGKIETSADCGPMGIRGNSRALRFSARDLDTKATKKTPTYRPSLV
jgi:hypothetical protein